MTESAHDQHPETDVVADGSETMIPVPASALAVLIASAHMIGDMLPRAWGGLETSNEQFMRRAALSGLMIEREPTAEEIEAGEFADDDLVLSFSPVFAEVLTGTSAGIADAMASMDLPEDFGDEDDADEDDADGDDEDGEGKPGEAAA